MVKGDYVPDRGDIIWIDLDPQAGHEQKGTRPAYVVSPQSYNEKIGLAIVLPITNQKKGYPFEVNIPNGLEIIGVILADQIKSLDWKERNTRFACKTPSDLFNEIMLRTMTLLE